MESDNSSIEKFYLNDVENKRLSSIDNTSENKNNINMELCDTDVNPKSIATETDFTESSSIFSSSQSLSLSPDKQQKSDHLKLSVLGERQRFENKVCVQMNVHCSVAQATTRDDTANGNKIPSEARDRDRFYDEEFVFLSADGDISDIASNVVSAGYTDKEKGPDGLYLSKSLPELSKMNVSETDIISETTSSKYLKDAVDSIDAHLTVPVEINSTLNSSLTTSKPSVQAFDNAYSSIGLGCVGSHATPIISKSTNTSIVNRSCTLKNKPIILTAKTRMSEITQTTAKVSIGNTTISVPLLKPVSSAQIMQSSGDQKTPLKSVTTDDQFSDHQQKQILAQNNTKHTRILNVNRSQKLNPTIVSLSHFKIKPSSNAKIVQATVVSKKLQLPNMTDSNDKMQLAADATSKTKSNCIQNISYSKLSSSNVLQDVYNSTEKAMKTEQMLHKSNSMNSTEQVADVLQDNCSDDLLDQCDSSLIINKLNVQSTYQRDSNTSTHSLAVKSRCNDSPMESKPDIQIHSEIREIPGCTAVKNILASVSLPIQPLSPLSKSSEINSTILKKIKCNISPNNSSNKVFEVVPHFFTKSITGSTFTTRSPASTTMFEPTTQRIPTSLALSCSPSKRSASFLSVPRTISLMLSKSSNNQQIPTTIPMNLDASTENAVSQNTTDQITKKISFPKMITLKKSPVIGIPLEDFQKPFHIIPISSNLPQGSALQGACLFEEPIKKKELHSSLKPQVPHSTDVNSTDAEFRLTTTPESTYKRTCVDTETTAQSVLIRGPENFRNVALNVSTNSKNTTCNIIRETNVNNSQIKSQVEKPISAISKSLQQSPSKAEDSQNILLKQLLKNTSSNNVHTVPITSSAISSVCSQALSNRKIINIRAPSLGLVSSLEAQLARPVIPPVTETTVNIPSSNSASMEHKIKNKKETEKNEFENDANSKLPENMKQSFQKISKETSFVSNPKFFSSNNTSKFSAKTTALSSIPFSNVNISPTINLPDISVSMYESTVNTNSPAIEVTKANTFGITENNINRETNITNKNKLPVLSNLSIGKQATQSEINICTTKINSHNPSAEENNSNDNCSLQNPLSNSIVLKTTVNDEQNILPCEEVHSESLSKKKKKELDSNTEKKQKEHYQSSKRSKSSVILDNVDYGSHVSAYSVNSSSSFVTCINNTNFSTSSLISPTCTQKFEGRNAELSKGIEKRRKRKREFYKHRRQFPNANKESPSIDELTNCRKRSRKCYKNEEDYDVFMDKTLFKMKQMSSLQVLEPFLCRNMDVITTQNSKDLTKAFIKSEHDNSPLNTLFHGRLDLQRSMDFNFYDVHPFGSTVEPSSTKNQLIMQNDFYDQEFFLDVCNNKKRKLNSIMSAIKDKNVDISDNILSTKCAHNISKLYLPKWNSFLKTAFPGIAVINNDAESLGRISPVIPHVDPTQFHLHRSLPVIQLKMLQNTSNNSPQIRKHLSNFDEEKNLTVILTVPSCKAINVLNILKKLANILHTSTVSSFKFMDDVSIYQKDLIRLKKKDNYINIQNVLNGTIKLCAGCKIPVTKKGIRTINKNIKNSRATEIQSELKPLKYHYFCSKLCYDQVRYQHGFFVERCMKSSNKNLKLKGNSRSLPLKKFKKCRFKYYTYNSFSISSYLGNDTKRHGKSFSFKFNLTTNDIHVRRSSQQESVILEKVITDTRRCILCNQARDGVSDGTSRLLNYDVDLWVHLNCALWSNGVYETISGGLMNVEIALQNGINQVCSSCQHLGATIKCFKNRCNNTFHLLCAKKEQCVFYKNKTVHCQAHASKSSKDNELISISALRRIFVDRDENRQVAAIMHHSDLNNLLRVGSLIFLNVGQLLPHQVEAFHTTNYIYPVGYKAIRFYWSMNTPGERCRYICTIAEVAGRPEFRVEVQDQTYFEIKDLTPNAVWHRILEPIVAMRKKYQHMRIFPKFVSGDELFGLNEPAIVRVLESLPGVETLTDYRFKYGRNPLLELPLAIHPSGAARTEPKQRQVLGLKKPHTQRTAAATNQRLSSSMVVGEIACPYSKQFVHSKSSQYKKMKQEWRNNVYLARSKIQGLGLYAARDVEKHTMVIEYIGEVIRTEVSEIREKNYESKNRGIYMFRLDEDRIVDATLSGGLARYINHSCNPNCVTEIVDVDRELRIIIFAKRRINRGEELSYDYKFDIEDDSNKLSCMCGAPNCRKWMN